MKIKIKFLTPYLVSTVLMGCGQSPSDGPAEPPVIEPVPTEPTEKLEIKISPDILSRATDFGFETNDRIGLYVVNYNNGQPGVLAESGNHVDNMGFTYSGIWTPDEPVYWKDETTHADFYLYYPYTDFAAVTAFPFSVKTDQSTENAYKASDMMLGKTTNITPTADATVIRASHVMSKINIHLEAGNGFTSESLAQSKIAVKINGVKASATVDLASGVVTPSGTAVSITAWNNEGDYQALIVPQSVPEGELITITVDDQEFFFRSAFTFESNKSYTFNIVVSKTSKGLNVNIAPWEEDGVDNGGVAE